MPSRDQPSSRVAIEPRVWRLLRLSRQTTSPACEGIRMSGTWGRNGAAPTIALHGAYRHDNFGDMLLLGIYIRWIRESYPGCRVILPLLRTDLTRLVNADGQGLTALMRASALVYGGEGYFVEPNSGRTFWALRKHLAPHAGRPDRADAGPSDRDQRRRRRPAVLPTRQATLRAALSLVGCGGRPRRGVTGLYGAIRSRGRPDGRDRRCRALPR
jgi:hypothetical protein